MCDTDGLVGDASVLNDIKRCCERACDMEDALYSSLLSFSDRLLLRISILSVALVSSLNIQRGSEVFSLELFWPWCCWEYSLCWLSQLLWSLSSVLNSSYRCPPYRHCAGLQQPKNSQQSYEYRLLRHSSFNLL